jgi:hypothetical protein
MDMSGKQIGAMAGKPTTLLLLGLGVVRLLRLHSGQVRSRQAVMLTKKCKIKSLRDGHEKFKIVE